MRASTAKLDLIRRALNIIHRLQQENDRLDDHPGPLDDETPVSLLLTYDQLYEWKNTVEELAEAII
jgi:hypothetical protein